MEIDLNEKLTILQSLFPDSQIQEVGDDIIITYGRIKRVGEYLIDCGVEFYFRPFRITFNKKELRMVE